MTLIFVSKVNGVKEYQCSVCGTRQVRDRVKELPKCIQCASKCVCGHEKAWHYWYERDKGYVLDVCSHWTLNKHERQQDCDCVEFEEAK